MNFLSAPPIPVEELDYHERNLNALGRSWRLAAIALSVCVALFLAWGLFAPLSKAAVAPGVVEVDGRRRAVENLEGGIIGAVLVREGDTVVKGQPLIRFDSLQTRAAAAAITDEKLALLAERQRIIDERRGGNLTMLPEELATEQRDARTLELISAQRELLAARRSSLGSQQAVLRQAAAQSDAQIAGIAAQIAAQQAQLQQLEAQAANVRILVSEQLERRSRLQDLERSIADAHGRIGALQSQLTATRHQSAESRARIFDLSAQRNDERATRLAEIRLQLENTEQKLASARDVDARRLVLAPASGKVVELQFNTVGEVAAPGDRLLDIVPTGQDMIVLAQVRPIDIERVRPGLSSKIRLVPFSTRRVRLLNGKVDTVSADTITPPDGSPAYYAARIRIADPDGIAPIREEIASGMPVEVFIELEKRSFFEALLQPLFDSFRRAMRE